MNQFSGTNSMNQKLRHVTYIEEWDFLQKHILSCEFLQSVYDLERMLNFSDELGAFKLLSISKELILAFISIFLFKIYCVM